MCGRFAQAQTREEYLAYLADEADRDIAYDPEPIGQYNVAPGTKVLLLSERDEQLHLDPVLWSYAPGWWDKAPLINARVETASTSRMFKPLWQHGRAICFADGWFEWKKDGDKKQPYFIHRADGQAGIPAHRIFQLVTELLEHPAVTHACEVAKSFVDAVNFYAGAHFLKRRHYPVRHVCVQLVVAAEANNPSAPK